MQRLGLFAGLTLVALAGCSEPSSQYLESPAEYAVMAADAVAEEGEPSAVETSGEIEVSAPQIAYTYSMGFDLPLGSIKGVQQGHAKLCEDRGPNVCRILSMRSANEDDGYASGELRLVYVADKARAFVKELETTSGEANGTLTSSTMTGEDLSKRIVDTEAQLRSRELLRDRLMQVLATRGGSVGELVEAERAVAQVNQEIDQARTWLKEMRGRVAFSTMTIRYEAGEFGARAGSFFEPIVSAWRSLGSILGTTIAAIMITLTVLFPIAIVIGVLRLILHRFGYRLRFWKTDLRDARRAEAPSGEEPHTPAPAET